MPDVKTIGKTSIKKNIVLNIILTVSNFLFPLITYAYVARVLLPEGTGKVAFAKSVVAYFVFFAALGISSYGIRECSKVREKPEELSKLVQELLRINLCSMLVSFVALIILTFTIPRFFDYKWLFIILSLNVALQPMSMEWLYNALEQYSYITIRSIIFKSLSVILTFILIHKPEDFLLYAGISVITTSGSYILNFVHSRKFIYYKKYDNYNLRQHLTPVFIFFFSTVAMSIYAHLDTFMLGLMYGNYDVGIYNAAYNIKNVVTSVTGAVASVLIPRISIYYGKNQKEMYLNLLQKSYRLTMILTFPLALYVALNIEDVVLFVCGAEYLDAIPSAIIFMICAFVLTLTNLFGMQILIPKGKEKLFSLSVFIGLIVNIVLNFIFIPKYGALGAAMATLATESVNAIIMGIGCKEEIAYLLKNINYLKYFVSLITATIVEVFIIRFVIEFPLLIRLILTTIGMFSSYYLMLIILKDSLLMEGISVIKKRIFRRF